MFLSLDLEFSGFDPDKDEILEIGAVEFELRNGQVVELGRFQTLVKPTQPIKKRITAVTGLSSEDFTEAPSIEDVLPDVKKLLAGKIVVGHGTSLDLRYLGKHGLVAEKVIDTLELAQAFLPIAESYNLEFLSADLDLAAEGSHRALQDAINAMNLCAYILGQHSLLADETKNRIYDIAVKGELAWAGLLATGAVFQNVVTKTNSELNEEIQEFFQDRQNTVAAVGRHLDFISLSKSGLKPFISGSQRLDARKVRSLELSDNISPFQAIFLIKLIVWQEQRLDDGWLGELNMTMLPSGLMESVAKGVSLAPAPSSVSLVWNLPEYQKSLTNRDSQVVFWGLDAAERYLEKASGEKLTWRRLSSLIKRAQYQEDLVAPPELEELVAQCYSSVDLFFGLLGVTSNKLKKQNGRFLLDELDLYTLGKLGVAAHNTATKLQKLSEWLDDSGQAQLQNSCSLLEHFFRVDEMSTKRVRWVEIAENYGNLQSMPEDTRSAWTGLWDGWRLPSIATRFTELAQLSFGASFHALPLISSSVKGIVITEAELKALPHDKTTRLLVFSSDEAMYKFYESNIQNIRKKAATFVYGISGGATKLARMLTLGGNRVAFLPVSHLVHGGAKFTADEVYFFGWPTFEPTAYQEALLFRNHHLSETRLKLWQDRFLSQAITLSISKGTKFFGLIDFSPDQRKLINSLLDSHG